MQSPLAEKLNGEGQCFKNLIYETNATQNKIATDWFSEFHNLFDILVNGNC